MPPDSQVQKTGVLGLRKSPQIDLQIGVQIEFLLTLYCPLPEEAVAIEVG